MLSSLLLPVWGQDKSIQCYLTYLDIRTHEKSYLSNFNTNISFDCSYII